MKINKKAVTILAFSIGACVFVSTALADMAIGSGYDQLKGSVKSTAAKMEKGLDNYTIETLYTLKDNGQDLVQATEVKKIDNVRQMSEDRSTTQYGKGEARSNYRYSTPQLSIWKNGTEDKYFEMDNPRNPGDYGNIFNDPFERNGAPELEKIVDALVGNLKDAVQAETSPDGGRVYSGSLSEAQVPALVNAVSSFWFKEQMLGRGHAEDGLSLPEIDSDVFVKKVKGTAIENKEGLLSHVTGDVVLSGKDSNGGQHDLALNVVFKLSDIGSTKVAAPDMTGKKVERVSQYGNGLTSAYIGTYKNNIVMEKDGKFVKIGERTLRITGVQDGQIAGTYEETVKPGFEADYPNPYKFAFAYDPDTDPMSLFSYTTSRGERQKGRITAGGNGKIYLELNVEVTGEKAYRTAAGNPNFDGELDRVFEN